MRLSVKISRITKRRWNFSRNYRQVSRNYRQVSIRMLYIEYEKEKLDNWCSAVKTIAINRLNMAIMSYIFWYFTECIIFWQNAIFTEYRTRDWENPTKSLPINVKCVWEEKSKRNNTRQGEHITLEFRKIPEIAVKKKEDRDRCWRKQKSKISETDRILILIRDFFQFFCMIWHLSFSYKGKKIQNENKSGGCGGIPTQLPSV